ncbi:MAG: anti-sigma factor [Cyclobacteriaceae bacterium]
MQNTNPPSGPTPCSCMKMLQLIVDGEATADEEKFLRDHLAECIPCYEQYQVDQLIKTMVKTTCCGGQVPQTLAEQIRMQIQANGR